jgi:hypothetical protein
MCHLHLIQKHAYMCTVVGSDILLAYGDCFFSEIAHVLPFFKTTFFMIGHCDVVVSTLAVYLKVATLNCRWVATYSD